MKTALATIAAAVYVTGWLAVFGHFSAMWNQGVLDRKGRNDNAVAALFLGVVWPVYVPFHVTYAYFNGEPL